jgi:hypothetical protein
MTATKLVTFLSIQMQIIVANIVVLLAVILKAVSTSIVQMIPILYFRKWFLNHPKPNVRRPPLVVFLFVPQLPKVHVIKHVVK